MKIHKISNKKATYVGNCVSSFKVLNKTRQKEFI